MSLHHQQPMYVQPDNRKLLSVSDIERLAKSGVHVDFKDVAEQIMQDPPPATKHTPLIDAFWDRYWRARPEQDQWGRPTPYQIAAIQYEDLIYVFVGPRDRPPFVIEDQRVLYPSDALMAKMALLEQTK